MTNDPNQERASTTAAKQQPTHIAKTRVVQGEHTSFERIGVAWLKEDGALYIRLHGTQIISDGFTLYPNENGGAR